MEILEAIVIAFISMASAEGATGCWVSDPHVDVGTLNVHVLCERKGYEWSESVVYEKDGEPVVMHVANGRMS